MAQKESNIFSEVKPPKKSMMPGVAFIILIIVLIGAVGAAGYLYWENMQLKKNPQQVAQQQVKDLVIKVGRLILLPTGETPTVATVTDPKLLKDQPFFNNTMKGDQLLIYTNAKKAILYRPSTNQIVDVAPLTIGNTPAATPPTPTPTTPSTKKP